MEASEIRRFCPTASPDLTQTMVEHWDAAEAIGLVAPRRIQHYMARVAVETGGLRSVSESLNYTPQGLSETFGKRISAADAARLGRTKAHRANQEAIANIVYGGAWGKKKLGNMQAGDGWKYRGGGALQTTGRANYKKAGFENNPEALRDPVTAFLTSLSEWARRGCNAAADRDDTAEVCRLINDGSNGLADQKAYLADARKVWPGVIRQRRKAQGRLATDRRRAEPGDEPVVDAAIVQKRLQDLHYTFAGGVDGNPGDLTEAAVMSFKKINGIEPITAEPDDQFIRVLMSADAQPFPIPEGRESITEADLRADGSQTIARADKVENAGNVGILAGGAGAVVTGLSSAFSTVREYLYPVQEFFQNVPGYVWFAVVAGGAGYIVWKTRHIKQGRVEQAREMRTFGTSGE